MRSVLVTIGRLSPDGGEWLTRYAQGVIPLIAEYGGTILTRALPREPIVGDADRMPDLVAVMRFPSEERLREFITSARYQAFVPHRERAFEWLRSYVADEAM